ncbi:hypothetical protein BDV97DRAFT_396816 [Delphinella strobiligena]|nr:hypothetical protein BDV97DRAFT_396816 [Delphinella strobiligena]
MSAPASPVEGRSALLAIPKADDPRSFHRFLELPPELRDRVYLEAARDIQSVALPGWEWEQKTWRPNLLKVSSQIRAEAEEYMLSECELVTKLERQLLRDQAGHKLVRVRLSPATGIYFNNLSDVQFSKIKRLRFICQLSFLDVTSPYLNIATHIDLTDGQQGLRRTRQFPLGVYFPEYTIKTQITVLSTLLAEICARKTGKFERADLERIVEAIGDMVCCRQTPQESTSNRG